MKYQFLQFVRAVRFCSSLSQDLEVFFFSLRAPISSFLAGQIPVLSFQADLVFRCLPELKIHPTPAGFCLIVIRAGCSVDFSSKSTSPGQICLSFDFCVAVLLVILFLPSKKYSFSSLPRTGSHQVDLLGLISKKPHQPLISFSLALLVSLSSLSAPAVRSRMKPLSVGPICVSAFSSCASSC
jgi:hypothetical protein